MFNEHQRDHMAFLATLPRHAKCPCQWYPCGDCWNCNRAELVRRGGQITYRFTGDQARYHLPSGEVVSYTALVAWLRLANESESQEGAGI